MFRFNDLKCDKCGKKLETFDDLSITRTGSFVCDYCDHRFVLMKCRGCGGIFKNKSRNYVWKGQSTGKIYSKKPEVLKEPVTRCHKCSDTKVSQEVHKYKIDPVPKDAIYVPPKKDYSEEILSGDYEIDNGKKRSETQMKSKTYLQPLVTDYEEGGPL